MRRLDNLLLSGTTAVSGGGLTTIVRTDIGVAHTVEEPRSLRLRKAEEVK
jgi:hypothetical protein